MSSADFLKVSSRAATAGTLLKTTAVARRSHERKVGLEALIGDYLLACCQRQRALFDPVNVEQGSALKQPGPASVWELIGLVNTSPFIVPERADFQADF
jgi:hypothetical protein